MEVNSRDIFNEEEKTVCGMYYFLLYLMEEDSAAAQGGLFPSEFSMLRSKSFS